MRFRWIYSTLKPISRSSYPTSDQILDYRLVRIALRRSKSKDQAEKALANAKAMSEVITITLVLFVTPFVLCEEVRQIGKLLEVHLDHLVGTLA